MVKTKENLTGRKFGRLTVIKQSEDFISGGKKIAGWYVFCDCNPNNIFRVRQKDLKRGHTQSCGCLVSENAKIVGKLNDGSKQKKYNKYDLSNGYGIGYTTKGEEFYFDLEDYDKIKNFCWRINEDGYVVSQKNKTSIYMHRLILNIVDADVFVDHIYHNKNDNRKSQLRICSNTENCRNTTIGKNNKSGVVGVRFNEEKQKWESYIKVNKKTIYLGRFDSINEAIECRLEAQNNYFGEFSNKENGKFISGFENDMMSCIK